MEKYVIAIGGNALAEWESSLDNISEALFSLSKKAQILITHGNGPQAGELSIHEKKSLALITKETQDTIGLRIKNSIEKVFHSKGESVHVDILHTEVLVDRKDKAFSNPSKPVGKFYKSNVFLRHKGYQFKKFEEGFRRIVPSPIPKKLLDGNGITVRLSMGNIVIAGGGGGIPIVYEAGRKRFADCIVDKDYTTAVLADFINADKMVILTNVNGVYISLGKNKALKRIMDITKAEEYMASGEFGEGSMYPKVKSCVEFVKKRKCRM